MWNGIWCSEGALGAAQHPKLHMPGSIPHGSPQQPESLPLCPLLHHKREVHPNCHWECPWPVITSPGHMATMLQCPGTTEFGNTDTSNTCPMKRRRKDKKQYIGVVATKATVQMFWLEPCCCSVFLIKANKTVSSCSFRGGDDVRLDPP